MKKRTVIWLVILLIIIVGLGLFTYKQWNTITAFIDSFRYSQEEVVDKINETKESVQEFIDESEDITVRDLTEEEAKALNEGNLTEDEVVELLTGKKPDTDPETQNNVSGTENKDTTKTEEKVPEKEVVKEPTPEEKKKEEANKKVSEAIAKLYIQKSTYLGKLDAIEAEVRGIYIAMSKEEKKGAKQRLLAQYLPTVASWESTCDGVVYGILDEIRAALKESGQDETIVNKLEEAYLNEKRLKKSYFINRYMD